MSAKQIITKLVNEAGISINGDKPWDIQVNDESVYDRVISNGRMAIGDSFVDKQWDSEDLTTTISMLFESGAAQKIQSSSTAWLVFKSWLFNRQNKRRAYQVGEEHYDLGNDMYEKMLDKNMLYTCAYWKNASNLDEAQVAKLDLICKKLDLQPGKRLLDIGCGWGGLLKYAAERYGVECVGVSVSKEQTEIAREVCKGLPVTIKIIDYRDFNDEEGFDYVTSIEMIEAVGPKNFDSYFKKVAQALKPDGKFLLQAIGSSSCNPKPEPWIDKHIFPNGIFPSLRQIEKYSYPYFIWDHLEDIGSDYVPTLTAWWENLENGYPELHKKNPEKYNERFLRTFKYYLQTMAANAQVKGMYDWQIVFTRK